MESRRCSIENKIRNISQKTPDTVIEEMLVEELPREILDYYMKNDYSKRRIPLSAKTVKEIAKILDKAKDNKKI